MNFSTFFEMLKNFEKIKRSVWWYHETYFWKFKKVDEILTKPFFEKFKKSWWPTYRPTDIHDLRIYATSRRIKRLCFDLYNIFEDIFICSNCLTRCRTILILTVWPLSQPRDSFNRRNVIKLQHKVQNIQYCNFCYSYFCI